MKTNCKSLHKPITAITIYNVPRATRQYLLDTQMGLIKAEVDAALPACGLGEVVGFDLPVQGAARLARY